MVIVEATNARILSIYSLEHISILQCLRMPETVCHGVSLIGHELCIATCRLRRNDCLGLLVRRYGIHSRFGAIVYFPSVPSRLSLWTSSVVNHNLRTTSTCRDVVYITSSRRRAHAHDPCASRLDTVLAYHHKPTRPSRCPKTTYPLASTLHASKTSWARHIPSG